VTRLEDRLRVDLRTESERIEPANIPALRLQGPASHPFAALRRIGSQRWPKWVTPLVAAAAVAVVVAGTFTIVHGISRTGAKHPAADGGPTSHPAIPPYYAYAVQGNTYSGARTSYSVIARYVQVRATATGKVITTVNPPAPYNAFESFAGDANGRTFVFATHWDIFGKNGTDFYQRSQRTPLKFMVLRITADGRTRLSPLSLQEKLTEAQAPTLAVSPDGTKLAVAFGGSGKTAVVQVITLATGQMRQWVSPPPAATPVLTGLGAWTSDERILAVGQETIHPDGTIPYTPTTMYMLDTAAPGSKLPTSRAVTLRGSHDFRAFISPDGSTLISELSSGPARARATTASGALAVYSARTGALLRVVGRWQLNTSGVLFNRPRQTVIWSGPSGRRLIVEMPRGKLGEVGFLTGNKFTLLPHVAQAPLLTAINNGGFQTDGGYVGFAW
jgi:hypothetical protein